MYKRLVTVVMLAILLLTGITFMATTHATQAATNDVWLLQRDLAGLGYMPMSGIDGISGSNTRASVRQFQTDNALQVDGDAGLLTMAALTNKVKEVQNAAGTSADGDYGPNTIAAVKSYQSRHGLVLQHHLKQDKRSKTA